MDWWDLAPWCPSDESDWLVDIGDADSRPVGKDRVCCDDNERDDEGAGFFDVASEPLPSRLGIVLRRACSAPAVTEATPPAATTRPTSNSKLYIVNPHV